MVSGNGSALPYTFWEPKMCKAGQRVLLPIAGRGPYFFNNYAEKKTAHHVCTHMTSKRIELEGPGWSGLVRF